MFTTVDSSEDIPIKSLTLGTVKDYNTNDIGNSCTEWRGATSKTEIERCDEETSIDNLTLQRGKQATNDIRTSLYRKEVDDERQGMDKDATLNLSVSPEDECSRERNVAVCREEDMEAESIQCAKETTKESDRLCCNVSSCKKILTLLMCNCTLLLSLCSNSLITVFDGCAKRNTQERDTAENTKSTMWKRFTLMMCISATLLTSSSCSLFYIFFPQEATRKEISLTVVGVVFSVFQFSETLVLPFAGKYGSRVGIKFMCLAAIFLEGSSTALFGILDKGPGGAIFAVECIAIRIVEAIGCACFYVAAQSILSHQYSDIGFVFSVLDSTMNVGFMIGPSVGGFLYELGGFSLPFYVIGSCMLVNGLVLYLFLPDIRDPEKEKEEDEQMGAAEPSSSSSSYRLLRLPLVLISWTSIALTTAGVSMYQTLYTARMATFDMEASVLGGLFTIGPLTFIVSAMLFGYLSRFESLRGIFMTAGQVLLGLSFLVNAPGILFPFIPFDDIWTASLSFVTMSFCAGILQIIGTSCILTGAWETGYENNLQTYAIVSGLYNTAYCGGCAVGPLVGGAAVDRFGFTKVFTVYGLASVCFTSLMLGYFVFRCKRENETRKTTEAKGYGSIEGGVEM